ncbi:MAG: organic solvent tolerance protein OstA [Oscillatoriales cyanobacterium]|nr:MAG: organic solvent tolerance protein OstA [Oscillatoriales cyanobacterium]
MPATAQPAAPTPVRQPMTVISDVQEANSIAGIVTARGNVQVDYPARMLKATAAQAQYFSNERRLVMSGDVFVLQDGNSLRAETVTYYVDEGRSIALPAPNRQVESIYLVLDTTSPTVLPSSTGPAGGLPADPNPPSLFAPATP